VRYLLTHLDAAWALTVIHLRLSLIPVVLGLLIAVPLGALIQRTTTLRRMTTITASIIFTIPSLALFVVLPLMIPTRILDETNVIVALTLYTTALLVRAVPEALDAVPEPVRDAATAVGYKPLIRMVKVELPLSIPVLIAGLRVVAVTNISMVSVGSVIALLSVLFIDLIVNHDVNWVVSFSMIVAGGPPALRAICAARSTVWAPAYSRAKEYVIRAAFLSSYHFEKMIPQLMSESTTRIASTNFVAPVELVTSSIGELGIA